MKFRTGLLALALITVAVASTYGQAHFGMRAAPTIGYLSGSYVEDSGGGEWGVAIGLGADVHLFGNVDFVVGFEVMHQKGGRKIKTVESDTLWGYKFGYMYIPVMLRPRFAVGSRSWYVAPFTGVYFGLNGTCKTKDAQYHGFSTTCSENTVGGKGLDVDYGIPVGLDVIKKFEGGSEWLFFTRIDVGLANVLQGAEDLDLKAVHRTLLIGFGFNYPLY